MTSSSRRNGASEWLLEKVLSIVFLSSLLYIIFAVFTLNSDAFTADIFLTSVTNTIFVLMFLLSVIPFALLRGKAIIDDYVHSGRLKMALLIFLLLLTLLMMVISILGVMYYHFFSEVFVV